MRGNLRLIIVIVCIILVVGIVAFVMNKDVNSLQKNANVAMNNEDGDNSISYEEDPVLNPNEGDLFQVNSEKDLENKLSKLDSEIKVDEFNTKMLECLDITKGFSFFMMNTVAQKIQGFSKNGVHISINKDFFNIVLKEIFGQENAEKFKFRKDVEYTHDLEYTHDIEYKQGIYRKNGYYIFDYNNDKEIDNALEYIDKKIENDTITYEYLYNPSVFIPYYKKVVTLKEVIEKEKEYLEIEENPHVTITYTKTNGTYKLTSIEGIELLNNIRLIINENFEVSL